MNLGRTPSSPVCPPTFRCRQKTNKDHCHRHREKAGSQTPNVTQREAFHPEPASTGSTLEASCLYPVFRVPAAVCPRPPASPPFIPPAPTPQPYLPRAGLQQAPTGPPQAAQGSACKPRPHPSGLGAQRDLLAPPRSPQGSTLRVPPCRSRRAREGPLAGATPPPRSEPGHPAQTPGPSAPGASSGHLALRRRVAGLAQLEAAPTVLCVLSWDRIWQCRPRDTKHTALETR